MRASVYLLDAVVVANGFPLISGTTLTIEQGTVNVIKGANGAGKTSLLQLIGGLLPLSNGEGNVAGIDLSRNDRREVRRHVGWLGHEGSFYEDLTVRENLTFACEALSINPELIRSALERVELNHRIDTRAKDLSAGQRRRVGIAWLLLRRPEIWLLDEPYASVDSAGREFLENIIGDAAKAAGTHAGFRFFRPRTAIYLTALIVAAGAMVTALVMRPGIGLSVQHERAPLFVRLASGDLRNGYTIKIVNKASTLATFELSTLGLPNAVLTETDENLGPAVQLGLPVKADAVGTFHVFVSGKPGILRDGSSPIDFVLRDTTTGELTTYHSVFMGPNTGGHN